jgi:hypothetical protein
MTPIRNVRPNKLKISPEEIFKESSLDESVLNQGSINQTIIRAIIVAANVCDTDSVINCRKIPDRFSPTAFLIPISTVRSEARATDNTE